jgi:D-alanyl-D-alanine carboxypeptidase (penicillin-binding protein 5/6)
MDGSVSGVTAGVGFSQYQALQALLLPSSNNMSETLTNWAFGSQEGYIAYANSFLRDLGLQNTTVADASGFSPETMSTPSDLVAIGLLALDNPVIAQIVQQPTADIPGAGTIYNTNRLLGQSGINGIKTGNTNEAGGCFLVSSTQQYENGKTVTAVAAIMAAPTLTDAMNQTKPLLAQVKAGFGDTVVATAGQQFGHIDTAWGGQSAAIVAKNDATAFGWLYATPKVTIKLTGSNFASNQNVGTATIAFGDETVDVALVQSGDLQPPSDTWRLLRR